MFQSVFADDVGDPTDLLVVAAIIAFAVILALAGLYLHHRRETRDRRKREREFDEILIRQAVSAGQMATEKATEEKRPTKRRKRRRKKRKLASGPGTADHGSPSRSTR